MELLRRTGVGRDINRHYYTDAELQRDMSRPVVRALLALLRFRNDHSAFNGACELAPSAQDSLVLEWRNGADWARLNVDLDRMHASIACSQPDAGNGAPVWQSMQERSA
jgi:sucrose phosphorylase